MSIHCRRRLLAGAASLCLSLPVWAEPAKDLTDEVIVTGTKISGDFGEKSGIPLAKVPQSVQVLTAEDLYQKPWPLTLWLVFEFLAAAGFS